MAHCGIIPRKIFKWHIQNCFNSYFRGGKYRDLSTNFPAAASRFRHYDAVLSAGCMIQCIKKGRGQAKNEEMQIPRADPSARGV